MKKKRIRGNFIVNTFFIIFLIGIVVFFMMNANHGKREKLFKDVAKPFDKWELINETDNESTYRAILPKGLGAGMNISYASRSDFKIYIDGQLRKEFNSEDNNVPGKMIKTIYFTIPLNAEDSGKEIVIVKDNTIDEGVCKRKVYLCNDIGLFRQIVLFSSKGFIAALILAVVSGLTCLAGVIISKYLSKKQPITAMSAGILLISVWYIFDSDAYQFIFNDVYIDGVMAYIMALIFLYPFFCALDVMQNGRYGKIYLLLKGLTLCNFMTFTSLHFLNIAPFSKTFVFSQSINGALCLSLLVLLIVDFIKKRSSSYYLIVYGFIIVACCTVIDLVASTVLKTNANGLYIIVGLYFLLILSAMHSAKEFQNILMQRQEAIQASKAKSDFLASMSHEIRTPINSILGMNEMILRENDNNQIDEYAKTIASSGEYLLGIINDILDISKIEAGKTDIINNEFELFDFIIDIVIVLKERCKNKNLTALIDIDTSLPSKIKADELHIKQIVFNLISNAVKYTKEGDVELSVTKEDISGDKCLLIFSVRDTGIGICEEEQDLLFEYFTRLDLKNNAGIQGTGLGLSIIKGLLDIMDGQVTVDSTYGIGSTFTVSIPVEITDTKLIDTSKVKISSLVKQKTYRELFQAPKATILVVDDFEQNITLIKHLLKRTLLNIEAASSGEKSIEMCKKKKYDLILMDHMMPNMDGITALKLIREDENGLNRNTRAIAFTANVYSNAKEEYMSKGFNDYITKPIKSEDLERRLMENLDDSLVIKTK